MSKRMWAVWGIILLFVIPFFLYGCYYRSSPARPYAILAKIGERELFVPLYWLDCDEKGKVCSLDRGADKEPIAIEFVSSYPFKLSCDAALQGVEVTCDSVLIGNFPQNSPLRNRIVLKHSEPLFSEWQLPRLWLETILVPIYMNPG